MKPEFPYKRLPGRLVGIVRKASLWEGEDHLLSISGTRFVETYRRFYYRDIQAIVVRRCIRLGSAGAWMFSLFGISLASLWMRTPQLRLMGEILLTILGVLSLYRLVVGLFFSCRCHVQTAVSFEALPSLLRRWKLAPALDRIRARISEAQGVLPEDFSLPELSSTNFSTLETTASPARYTTAILLSIVGFLLCLANAAAAIYFMDGPTAAMNSKAMHLFDLALILLQGGAIVGALLQIYKARALRSLRNFLLAALCMCALEIYAGSFLSSLFRTEKEMVTIRIDMLSVWHGVQKADACLSLIVGLGGLCLVLMNWRAFRRGGLSAA
jgi:hypothetical protein